MATVSDHVIRIFVSKIVAIILTLLEVVWQKLHSKGGTRNICSPGKQRYAIFGLISTLGRCYFWKISRFACVCVLVCSSRCRKNTFTCVENLGADNGPISISDRNIDFITCKTNYIANNNSLNKLSYPVNIFLYCNAILSSIVILI